jgi:hypothetical protein
VGPTGDNVVDLGVGPQRLHDAERHGDQHRADIGEADEEGRLGDVLLQQRGDALVIAVGETEVPLEQPLNVMPVLQQHREVVAILGGEVLDLLGCGPGAEQGSGWAPGEKVDEQEHDQRDAEQYDDGLANAPHDKCRHYCLPSGPQVARRKRQVVHFEKYQSTEFS